MLVMATRKGKGTRERGAESCERSDSKGGDPPLAPSRRDTPRRWFLHLSAPPLGRHGAALPVCQSLGPPMGAESPAFSGHHQGMRLLSPSQLGCAHGDPQNQPTCTRRGDTTTHLQPLPPPGAGPATYFLPFLLSKPLSRGAPSHLATPRGLAAPSSRLCTGEREGSNPACGVVQCTSVASSPYGRTCCILIYCLFG